jgi:hypothetical protein
MNNKVAWITLLAVLTLAGCNKPATPAVAPANTTGAAAPFAPSYAAGGAAAPAAAPGAALADGSAPAPDASSPTPDQTAAFNASFDKSTHDSCVTSAEGNGATADAAEKYCTCVVAKLEPLSVQDKMALPQHQDTLTAAASACRGQ